jgi:hypothetical protein
LSEQVFTLVVLCTLMTQMFVKFPLEVLNPGHRTDWVQARRLAASSASAGKICRANSGKPSNSSEIASAAVIILSVEISADG